MPEPQPDAEPDAVAERPATTERIAQRICEPRRPEAQRDGRSVPASLGAATADHVPARDDEAARDPLARGHRDTERREAGIEIRRRLDDAGVRKLSQQQRVTLERPQLGPRDLFAIQPDARVT